jgi:hypothetical protein
LCGVRPATARLTHCLVLGTLLSSGCAFPLFNVEESSRPRRLAYRPSHTGAAVESERSRAAPARSTPALGPRRSSVLDPSPDELSREGSAGACYAALREAGVPYQRVVEAASGVKWPVRLQGPVRGVRFDQLDRDKTFAVLDCRLALALVDWAPVLRRAGVRRVLHYSMYRPGARIGGGGTVSSHAHGMAIDAAKFELESGAVIDVLDDWEGRKRGQDPCPVRRDESRASRIMRSVTCQAVEKNVFQIVLTPHYNRAHANHLHLERKIGVDWQFVK